MKNNLLQDIEGFRSLQKLKFTYRYSSRTFDGHKESTASHTWCMMVLCDYLLIKLEEACPGKYKLDTLKIYQMIIYHDLIEAQTGDIDIDERYSKNILKSEGEKEAFPIFLKKIPNDIKEVYTKNLEEYELRETLESKFVKLIDVTEAEFQCFFHKNIWENWTRKEYHEKRGKYHDYFPEIRYIYDEMMDYLETNAYFKEN